MAERINRNRRYIDPKQAEFIRQASATLGSSELRDAVKLPQGEDLNEWLAVNGLLINAYNKRS